MLFYRRHQQRGGSLLEVMICLFMLTLPIFGVTALRITQAQIILQQSQYQSAWSLMEYKLNELRYLALSSDEFSGVNTNVGGHVTAGNVNYDQYEFNLTWQVSSENKDIPSLLKDVLVRISWIDKAGVSHHISSVITLNIGIVGR